MSELIQEEKQMVNYYKSVATRMMIQHFIILFFRDALAFIRVTPIGLYDVKSSSSCPAREFDKAI